MSKTSDKSFGQKFKLWIIRFIKFNLVGLLVFLVGTAIYVVSFSRFGFWTWVVANGVGGVLQFSLITMLNRTQKGKIFDSCQQNGKP
jgi:hypothetical protein